jgi:hypothetical protein
MTSDQPTMTLLRPRMRTSANFARVEAARFDSLYPTITLSINPSCMCVLSNARSSTYRSTACVRV